MCISRECIKPSHWKHTRHLQETGWLWGGREGIIQLGKRRELPMVLEKTLENPLDCKQIQSVHPKADQSWVFIGKTDVKAETPILWPPDGKSWLIGKDPNARKDWGQEEKGTTEDEMVGWYHRLNGHGFDGGQGGLVCCGSWGCRVGHDWVTELTDSFAILDGKMTKF